MDDKKKSVTSEDFWWKNEEFPSLQLTRDLRAFNTALVLCWFIFNLWFTASAGFFHLWYNEREKRGGESRKNKFVDQQLLYICRSTLLHILKTHLHKMRINEYFMIKCWFDRWLSGIRNWHAYDFLLISMMIFMLDIIFFGISFIIISTAFRFHFFHDWILWCW